MPVPEEVTWRWQKQQEEELEEFERWLEEFDPEAYERYRDEVSKAPVPTLR